MLILFGAAVAIMVFEAASILTLTGMCASHGKKKRRNRTRLVADAGQKNRHGTGGNARVRNDGVIYAPGVGGGGGDGDGFDYRRTYGFKGGDYGDTDGYGNDGRSTRSSSSRSRGGDGNGGGDGGGDGDYGGDGGGCGGGGCGGGCGGGD